jgi:hypothetical protein
MRGELFDVGKGILREHLHHVARPPLTDAPELKQRRDDGDDGEQYARIHRATNRVVQHRRRVYFNKGTRRDERERFSRAPLAQTSRHLATRSSRRRRVDTRRK